MIAFNRPTYCGEEDKYIIDSVKSGKISGDGKYAQKCHRWFEKSLSVKKVFLTPSCTAALEMTAILIDIKEGDEVIMPSYTFVSTANAFVMRGAKIVFVDIQPDTMNIDENRIEEAISKKTKAIVVVHYAGVACEMDKIMDIANKYGLFVVEDAAQAMMSSYKGRVLGTIGDFGTYSFHETKNYTSGGEGGLLIVNNERFIERAEIIREKGTNRSKFFRGMVDKYSWVDIGSSYLMNDISAAYLFAQLEMAEEINQNRLESWKYYYENLLHLKNTEGLIDIPFIPDDCIYNGHIFYIKLKNSTERQKFINYMKDREISVVFHYVPLHSSYAGRKFGCFHGEDRYTTFESERLVRLPLYYNIPKDDLKRVVQEIYKYFKYFTLEKEG